MPTLERYLFFPNMQLEKRIRDLIQDVPDFPKPGILFKDITPIFSDSELCGDIRAHIANTFRGVDAIAGIESRGFFWGMSVAQQLEIPFIPIRKAGKLPRKTIAQSYELEYGTATLEMHEDAIQQGWKVLIHDDLLATGGTAEAAARLISFIGKVAGFSFIVDLEDLGGQERLASFNVPIDSLVTY